MTLLEALVLGIVEGLTEFLPISSTGHLILASSLLGIPQSEFLKSFEIIIQLGAISAVILLYGRRLWQSPETIQRVLVAFIPTGAFGLLLYPFIKSYLLGNSAVVVASLFLGGILMLVFERWYRPDRATVGSHSELTFGQAALVGSWQVLALVPGVSRSAATAVGGMIMGLDRKSTIEFSFMLAIPTMLAAAGYDLVKNWELVLASDLSLLAAGFLSAFVCALFAVEFLLRHVERRTFREFAWYRIIVALVFYVVFL